MNDHARHNGGIASICGDEENTVGVSITDSARQYSSAIDQHGSGRLWTGTGQCIEKSSAARTLDTGDSNDFTSSCFQVHSVHAGSTKRVRRSDSALLQPARFLVGQRRPPSPVMSRS